MSASASARRSPRIMKCRFCKGVQAGRPDDADGHPWGWYSLSVNVPAAMGKNGKPFVWVGVWCSAMCMASDMPRILAQEELARELYAPDEPYRADSDQAQQLAAVLRMAG